MASIELERRLIKSPLELWDDVVCETTLRRRLGEVQVCASDPPHQLQWVVQGASGVIELVASGWGTKVRILAEMDRAPAWERLQARYVLEHSLRALLDDLSSSSLKSG
jgi:hypothetical protein